MIREPQQTMETRPLSSSGAVVLLGFSVLWRSVVSGDDELFAWYCHKRLLNAAKTGGLASFTRVRAHIAGAGLFGDCSCFVDPLATLSHQETPQPSLAATYFLSDLEFSGYF